MVKFVRFGAVVLAACNLAACATLTRGTYQKFAIISDPDNAEVEMTNGLRCTTPCSMKIRRKSDFVVKVLMEGYETAEVRVQGKFQGGGFAGGVLGNFMIGGVLGAGYDITTGAMLSLTPNPIEVTLRPLRVPAVATLAVPEPAPAPIAASVSNPAPVGPPAMSER